MKILRTRPLTVPRSAENGGFIEVAGPNKTRIELNVLYLINKPGKEDTSYRHMLVKQRVSMYLPKLS